MLLADMCTLIRGLVNLHDSHTTVRTTSPNTWCNTGSSKKVEDENQSTKASRSPVALKGQNQEDGPVAFRSIRYWSVWINVKADEDVRHLGSSSVIHLCLSNSTSDTMSSVRVNQSLNT